MLPNRALALTPINFRVADASFTAKARMLLLGWLVSSAHWIFLPNRCLGREDIDKASSSGHKYYTNVK
jgi:hypothetical protein